MIRLKHIINEMAMRPTLEREFETIVRGFQDEYTKYVKEYMLKAIDRAVPDFEAANKEATEKNKMMGAWDKTYGTYGKYNDRVFGLTSFFRSHVFLQKEYASTKEPKFKKELNAALEKWQAAKASGDVGADKLWELWRVEMQHYVKMPESYYMAKVDKEADWASQMFYTSFINKNVAKFSDVIKGKDITGIRHNLSPRNLTGNLIIDCSDGSHFRASFSVETSVSKNGKWFNRFPTRFHDVIFADGTRMASPSEAKMKSNF